MKPGYLYKIDNGGLVWIVIFKRYKNNSHLYYASIVAQGHPFLNHREYLDGFFETKGELMDIKELPLYIELNKSPLFEQLLRGEV